MVYHHTIWVLILSDLSKSLTSLDLRLLIREMGEIVIILLSTSQGIVVTSYTNKCEKHVL